MKRWWVWVVLLLSLGVNVGILATLGAQRLREPAPAAPASTAPAPRRPSGPGPGMQRLADRLGLEGETRRRFLDIQRDAFETMRGEREKLQSARQALRLELASEQPDRQRVESLLAEVSATQAALERALVGSFLESRALLDADQQRLYTRFVEERLRPQAPPGRDRRPLRQRRRP